VRLIRSKGVGVYFVTHNPLDIPENVLGQLGNRVQHALPASTPRDQKALASVAETMRPNPKLDLKAAILELAVGEALISFLDRQGAPSITERTLVMPRASQIGPITPDERRKLIESSVVAGVYEKTFDRECAFEMLKARAGTGQALPGSAAPAGGAAAPATQGSGGGLLGGLSGILFGSTGPRGGRHDGLVDSMAKSAARTVGSAGAREVVRGVLGSLLSGKR